MVAVLMGRRLARADVPALCARAETMLETTQTEVLLCDAGALEDVDAVAVDALARLHLVARRHGCEFRVCRASPELRSLVRLMGLHDIVLDC